jgi:hypothetical protein
MIVNEDDARSGYWSPGHAIESICLVDESGRLECVQEALPAQESRRKIPQLRVNQRHQAIRRSRHFQ